MSQPKSLFMLPWYPRDFMSSTRGWSVTARGVYRELLDAQWDMGELPVDPDELRTLIGATEKEWAISWPKIEHKFPLNCSGRKNLKLERVRADAEEYSARKSEAGRKGGLASASKRQATVEQTSTTAEANVKHQSLSLSLSLSESQSLQKEKKPMSAPQTVVEVFEHWKTVHKHPLAKLDTKRQKLITAALSSYSVADLCQSITGYRNSPHHMGQNDRATVYDDIEIMLRDAKHIDAGIKFGSAPPRTDLSSLTRKNISAIEDWVPPEMRKENASA